MDSNIIKYENRILLNRCIIKNDIDNFIRINNTYTWVGYELVKAVESGSIDIVAYLLSNGFDNNTQLENVVDIAAINCDIDIVYLLLQNKYKPSLNGFTTLITTHKFNMIKIIAPYVKYKQFEFCNIAKKHAAINNNYEIFNLLRSQWSRMHSPTKEKIIDISSPKKIIDNKENIDNERNINNDEIKSSLILHTLKRSYHNRDVYIYIISKDGLLSKSNLTIETNVPYDWIPIKTHYGLNWFKLKEYTYNEIFQQDKFMKDYNHVELNNPYGYDIKLNKDFFVVEKDEHNKSRVLIRGPDLSLFINNLEILNNKSWYIFSPALKKNVQKLVIAGQGNNINVNSQNLQHKIKKKLKTKNLKKKKKKKDKEEYLKKEEEKEYQKEKEEKENQKKRENQKEEYKKKCIKEKYIKKKKKNLKKKDEFQKKEEEYQKECQKEKDENQNIKDLVRDILNCK